MTKKKKAKKRTKAMVSCPKCKNCQCMVLPKSKCTMACRCRECGDEIKAKKCCVFCDYANKPCGCCETRKKKKK